MLDAFRESLSKPRLCELWCRYVYVVFIGVCVLVISLPVVEPQALLLATWAVMAFFL